MEQLISSLKDSFEKNGENDENVVKISNQIASQIVDVNEEFYQLPLSLIFKILEKVDFSQIHDASNVIRTIASKTVQAHGKEKEVLMILQSINLSLDMPFSKEECISILSCFKNCPLCIILETLNSVENHSVDVDLDFELTKRDKEIAELRRQIAEKDQEIQQLRSTLQSNNISYDKPSVASVDSHQQVSKPIKKPFFYESDIIKAIQKGKLSSVQYNIETNGLDVNTITEGKSFLDIARQYNQKDIEQYLISKGAKDMFISPMFADAFSRAIQCDDVQSVKQIIGKMSSDINSTKPWGFSPLLHAKLSHANNVYNYLKSIGATMKKEINIVLLGDDCAGKYTLYHRILDDKWVISGPNIGASCGRKLKYFGDIEIDLRIWVLNGYVKYRQQIPMYIRNLSETDNIFLCYDLTSKGSFEELNYFINVVKDNCEKLPKLCVVGLKSDLNGVQVTQEMVDQFISKYSNVFTFIGSFNVSSYNGENIDVLMNSVYDYSLK